MSATKQSFVSAIAQFTTSEFIVTHISGRAYCWQTWFRTGSVADTTILRRVLLLVRTMSMAHGHSHAQLPKLHVRTTESVSARFPAYKTKPSWNDTVVEWTLSTVAAESRSCSLLFSTNTGYVISVCHNHAPCVTSKTDIFTAVPLS